MNEVQGILKRDPSNVPSRRLLARIYIRSARRLVRCLEQSHTVNLAIEQFREIVRLDPTDEDSAIWLARLYRLTTSTIRRSRCFATCSVRDPDNEAAVSQLTQLLLDEDKSQDAIALLQQSIARAPSGGLYDQLGDAYTQIHDLDHAEQAYRSAVELEPDQVSHHRGLAQSLFDEGKFPAALSEYQKLAEMEPNDANNYLRLSEIYRQLQQLDKAEAEVLLAKQRAPGNLEVIYNEAAIYQAEGRYDDGDPRAFRCRDRGERRRRRSRRRGAARWRSCTSCSGRFIATGELHRGGEHVPGNGAAGSGRGSARAGADHRQLSKGARPAARLRRSAEGAGDLSRRPQLAHQPGAAVRREQSARSGDAGACGHCWITPRTIWRSISTWRRCTRKASASRCRSGGAVRGKTGDAARRAGDDRLLAGRVYEREKKYDQAEQAFQGVLAINPRNAAALNYYGYMLADRGVRLDEAVNFVQRALAEDPHNAAYLDSLGWAYYKQDKYADAEKYLAEGGAARTAQSDHAEPSGRRVGQERA